MIGNTPQPRGIITNATEWRSWQLQGKCKFQGLPISIENERGSFRQGYDDKGRMWRTFMHMPYGYIRLTMGTDGDHVDCYIGPHQTSIKVFIVHQQVPETKAYDEDKIMLGFDDAREARYMYERQYDKPGFFQSMEEHDMATFKKMLKARKGMKLKKSRDDEDEAEEDEEESERDEAFEREQRNEAAKDNRPMRFKKAKYTRRWKGKDGKWQYEYGEPKGKVKAKRPKLDFRYTRNAAYKKVGDGKFEQMDQVEWDAHISLNDGIRAALKGHDLYSYNLSTAEGHQQLNAAYWDSAVKNIPGIEAHMSKEKFLSKINHVKANTIWDQVEMVSDWLTPRMLYDDSGEFTGLRKGVADALRDTSDEKFDRSYKLDSEESELEEEDDESVDEKLGKAKYIRRWRSKDGKWNYEYPREGVERKKQEDQPSLPGLSPKDIEKLKKKYERKGPGDGKEKTIEKPAHLDALLRHTTICMMSAGRNPNDPEDMKMSEDQIKERYNTLLSDLIDKGYIYTRCRGKYVNPEESVMVMCHDADRADMMELGSKYKQDSIVFSDKGHGSLIYTTGEKAGQEEMAGDGYGLVPDATDFYTKMPLGDGSNVKFTINLEEIMKALGFPNMCLIKSNAGEWYLKEHGMITRFWWFHGLEKAIKTKSYYSPEEVKARGMRWVTIRGARVLLQGTSDGGYVVVGGAGGKLNHLKIDRILGKEEYAAKRKQIEKKGKEETRALSKEEIAEQRAIRKKQVVARRTARAEYTAAVGDIIGVTPEEIRSEITGDQMSALESKARKMVEARAAAKTMDATALEEAVDKQTESEVNKAVEKQVKNVERAALQTLVEEYSPADPNEQPSLTKLLDKDKALEVLAARKQFRSQIKEIGKESADIPTDLKIGAVTAATDPGTIEEVQKDIKQQIETQKNMRLYDMMNAQSTSIQRHIDQGAASSLNGLIGDIYGAGATFSQDTIERLGIEAVSRAITIKIQQDGKGAVVKKALEDYVSKEREKVVTEAIKQADKRFKNADELRKLSRDTGDAEAVLSLASANGYALKQITGAQRALGTAVGSLRAAAHMLNALDDPPADVVQIDMGKDLARAREHAKAAGLAKGTYSIRTKKQGRGKRLIMEIPKESLNNFFQTNIEKTDQLSRIDQIKRHKMNDGYTPPGIKENIKLDPAQEAGLKFFMEKKRVLLDFEAGLGKTAVAYSAVAEAIANHGAKKILMVVPSKPMGDFRGQASTFLDKDIEKKILASTTNTSRAERRARHAAEEGIHIVSQDSLREDASILKDSGYDMVVVDEVHEMTAGTGQAGRFKALKELDEVPLKIAMSGTNIKNDKKEMYRKIDFIDPGHSLGTMKEFESRYKGLNQGTGIFADAANDAFRKEIAEWNYTQKNQLPVENKHQTIRVPMSADQRRRYAASEKQYRQDREAKKPGAAGQRDSRNYSILSNGASEENAKMDTIVGTMNSDHKGEKAVIHVSQTGKPVLKAMRTAAARLNNEYGKGSAVTIDGDTGPGALADYTRRFNDPGEKLRFIVGTKTIESGHNFQKGGTVTWHLDIPDSQAAMDQRNARVFRKGQEKDTSSYVLSGLNPMDMRSEDLIETKRKEQGILGNPREVDAMDETGFIGMLNKYEEEFKSA